MCAVQTDVIVKYKNEICLFTESRGRGRRPRRTVHTTQEHARQSQQSRCKSNLLKHCQDILQKLITNFGIVI